MELSTGKSKIMVSCTANSSTNATMDGGKTLEEITNFKYLPKLV